jgi:hypothetical protein
MRDHLSATGDLVGGQVDDWLVVGWFTPDYRPLAEAFAANLTEHGAPYHLFAKPKLGGGWDTTRKPSVVLEAMDAYHGKTLVLMDVDCVVRGDITPVTEIDGDMGVILIARDAHKGRLVKHWLMVEASSRVVVFKPTDSARLFTERWQRQIERSNFGHDEHSMAWSILQSPDVRFAYIPQAFSAREISQDVPGAVIVHESEHERQKRSERGGLKRWLRAIERPFRTGRTKAGKLQGELSAVQL